MTPAALLPERWSPIKTEPDDLPISAAESLPPSVLQLLFNTLQVGLAVVNEEGILVGHNAAWGRLLVSDLPNTAGLARGSNVIEACLGSPPSTPFDALAVASGLESIFRRVTSEFRVEYTIGRGPLAATFEIRGFACEQGPTMWALLSHEEITPRRKAEVAAVEAAERLREANRDLKTLNRRLQRLVSVDELTSLLNRRAFEQRLATAWETCQREGRPVSLAFFDVDCFKQYNDSCGHPAGDICLQTIARILAKTIVGTELVAARYGGEEFAVILPGWNLEQSWEFAQTFRRQINALALPHPASSVTPRVTISGGVGGRIGGGDSPREMVHRTDAALYAAKRGGRNRICLAPEGVTGESRGSSDTK